VHRGAIGCIFQIPHRRNRIGVRRLDVAVLRHRNGGMLEQALYRLVRDSETVQVCRQPAPECVPDVPLNTAFLEGRADHVSKRQMAPDSHTPRSSGTATGQSGPTLNAELCRAPC